MLSIFSFIFVAFLGLLLFLHLLSLPANWLIVFFTAVWWVAMPESLTQGMDWQFFAILIGLCVAGEVLEFFLQLFGSKRYGASGKGMWGGFFGGLLGAIFGMPFLLGIGALIGALLGAFAGCFIVERLSGKPWDESLRAAQGTLVGRFLGMISKTALGFIMVVMVSQVVWPNDILYI